MRNIDQRSPSQPDLASHGLWSLLDMLTKFARPFILLGEEIDEARMLYRICEGRHADDPEGKLNDEEKRHVSECFRKILMLCTELDLEVSKELFVESVNDIPTTTREYEILIKALYAEVKNKLFVFVPSHRTKYMQARHFMSAATKETFPKARSEMSLAGKCYAVGLYTAAVFHCVRAVEIGLRTMAIELRVELQFPIEQADQETLIGGIEAKIKALKEQTKSEQKDNDQNFYSKAAMEFRYFKDGWRVRVAHTRATYEEPEA